MSKQQLEISSQFEKKNSPRLLFFGELLISCWAENELSWNMGKLSYIEEINTSNSEK
jgi:hypothetical protein